MRRNVHVLYTTQHPGDWLEWVREMMALVDLSLWDDVHVRHQLNGRLMYTVSVKTLEGEK